MTILDVKSGKVMPWTALQLSGYERLDTPVEYEDDGHRYTLNGLLLPSVTGILLAEGFIDTTWYTEEARTRGSYVHKARHLDDTGELDESTIDPVIAPYLEAWRRFKRETGFVVEESEVPKAQSSYLYAGTPDVNGHFPKPEIHKGQIIKRAAVELHDNGTYKLIPFTDRQDANVWLSVLAVHNWKKNNLRRAA